MESKSKEDNLIATVGDLIKYLQDNCKPEDKLCMFYEGGAYINLERIPKTCIGNKLFIYVKNFKKINKDLEDDLYSYVKDNDLIVY